MADLITEEGLAWIAGVVFAKDTQPTELVARLVRTSGATPDKESVYADLTYLSTGNGYAPVSMDLDDAVVSGFQTNDAKVTFDEITFTATGTWEEVGWLAITHGTVLIAFMQLPSPLTLADGVSLPIVPEITLTSG